MKLLIFLIFIFVIGCAEKKDSKPEVISPYQKAQNTLDAIEDDGYNISYVKSQSWADGKFAHLIVSAQKKSSLRSKFAINENGQLIDYLSKRRIKGLCRLLPGLVALLSQVFLTGLWKVWIVIVEIACLNFLTNNLLNFFCKGS